MQLSNVARRCALVRRRRATGRLRQLLRQRQPAHAHPGSCDREGLSGAASAPLRWAAPPARW
eukprot:3623325-Prymnesium_polylepis.1